MKHQIIDYDKMFFSFHIDNIHVGLRRNN